MTCNYFSNAAPCVYQNVNASIITGCMFAPRMSEPSSCQSHLKIKSQISRQLDNTSDSQYSLSWQLLCSCTNHGINATDLIGGVCLRLAGMDPGGRHTRDDHWGEGLPFSFPTFHSKDLSQVLANQPYAQFLGIRKPQFTPGFPVRPVGGISANQIWLPFLQWKSWRPEFSC